MWRTLLLSCLVFICIHPFPFTLCLKPDSRTPLNHFGLNNSPSQNSNYCNSCRFIHQLYSFVASIPILVAESLSCLFNSHFPNLRVPPNHPSHETLWGKPWLKWDPHPRTCRPYRAFSFSSRAVAGCGPASARASNGAWRCRRLARLPHDPKLGDGTWLNQFWIIYEIWWFIS